MRKIFAINKGIKYMLLAGVFFSLMNVLVKYLDNIPAIQIVFFRGWVTLVMSYVALKRLRIPLKGNNIPVLLLRAAFGAFALMLYFTTLQNAPFATAVTLQNLSPILTIIFGIFILGEKVKPWQWVFFAVSFLGVALIKGFDTNTETIYFITGLGAATFAALAYNMVRKLKDSDHPLVVVFYFPLVATPIAGVYCLFNWVNPSLKEWGLLILVGIFTQIAQVFMTKALQAENLAKVSIVRYLTIVYAVVIGFFVFKDSYNLLTLLGILFVVLGVVLNMVFKTKAKT